MAHTKVVLNVEDQQYNIWRKMTGAKTIKLASDFSIFLIRLSNSHKHGFRTTSRTNRESAE